MRALFFRWDNGFAALSGLLLWLAFPGGGGLWPLLAVALLPLLVTACRAPSALAACALGLTAGLVHFTLLLYWIVIVLSRYGGLAWPLAVLALIFLALYMALYSVLFALICRHLCGRLPVWALLWLLPALWVGLDWLRGWLFTGLPWMDLGYALYEVPLLIQVSDLVGHHGVSFLLVLVNALFLAFLLRRRPTGAAAAALFLPVLLLVGAVCWYGQLRLAQFDAEEERGEGRRLLVGVVQGNIDQALKWSPAMQEATLASYLAASRQLVAAAATAGPALIVWPETALPFYPQPDGRLEPLWQLVASQRLALLTGTPWYELVDWQSRLRHYYNSALLFRPDGSFGGRYDKHHLVPFGEYVPLRRFLPFLAPLVETVGDFTAGEIDRPLPWGPLQAGVLICFESVFPALTRTWVDAGANALINLTNDAWYGKSSAPWHSLAMAVFRAVESRRSLVRAANTGISAFIAPSGRIGARSGLFVPWHDQAEVLLRSERSWWVRGGYLFAPACLLLVVVTLLATGRRPAGATRRG